MIFDKMKGEKQMYKSEKRKEEFEESKLEILLISKIFSITILIFFINFTIKTTEVIENGAFYPMIKFIQSSLKVINIIVIVFLLLMILIYILEKIQNKNPKIRSKDWKVEVLKIKSKYRNDKISFKKAVKMIKKLKREKRVRENENLIKCENMKLLEKECSIFYDNQEKSVWID